MIFLDRSSHISSIYLKCGQNNKCIAIIFKLCYHMFLHFKEFWVEQSFHVYIWFFCTGVDGHVFSRGRCVTAPRGGAHWLTDRGPVIWGHCQGFYLWGNAVHEGSQPNH